MLRAQSADFALFAALTAGASLCNTVDGQSPQQQAPAGLTQYTFGTPSGDETEILEIINRARANPAAEGQRLVDMLNANFPGGTSGIDLNQLLADFQGYPARPPLAFNSDLNAAAQFHLPEMIAFGSCTHFSPNGDTCGVRMQAAGYSRPYGENVAAFPNRPVEADLTEDNYETDTNEPGYGHRLMVMEPETLEETEVGIAQKALGGWNVEDFGAGHTPTLLTGAVFTDNAATGFYVSGEGVASVTVTAPGASSFYAVTGEGGAYTLPLDLLTFAPLLSGNTVQVVFTDAAGVVTTQTVTLHHTVWTDGVTTYLDAAGNVRYDNAEADLVEPATAGSTSPTATMPVVTITKDADGTSFDLTRTGDVSDVLVVDYVVKGSAVAGQDYVALSGVKKFKPGKSSARIAVHALPGARGVIKLKLIPTANSYSAPAPAQAKMRLSDPE